MAPHETEKLDAILQQVGEHRSEFHVFRTEVLGSPTDEKPSGRLPRLEGIATNHEGRLRRLEGFVLLILGGFGVVKGAVWLASIFYKH